jgi:formylglycine-generating enzyme
MRRSPMILATSIALGVAALAYFGSTLRLSGAAGSAGPRGMVWIPGGEFTMGSDDPKARADERPAHRIRVDGFWMDKTVVTNAQFRAFVEATGYVTVAERKPDWEELKKQLPPGTPKPPDEVLKAGSTVFQPTDGPVDLSDWSQWWHWQSGADWRHPGGPGTSIDGKDDYPVVQVAWEDTLAYAKWAGKRLPTEAEYEFAARGGLDGKRFAWGDEFAPDGKFMANTWQGTFPAIDTAEDGFNGTSPVGSFPANGYGLFDITGNVWQHVSDWYRPDTYHEQAKQGVVANPVGPASSLDPDEPLSPKHVIRGGSFLCSEAFCFSYRPAARMKMSPDSALPNVGFRLVKTS